MLYQPAADLDQAPLQADQHQLPTALGCASRR